MASAEPAPSGSIAVRVATVVRGSRSASSAKAPSRVSHRRVDRHRVLAGEQRLDGVRDVAGEHAESPGRIDRLRPGRSPGPGRPVRPRDALPPARWRTAPTDPEMAAAMSSSPTQAGSMCTRSAISPGTRKGVSADACFAGLRLTTTTESLGSAPRAATAASTRRSADGAARPAEASITTRRPVGTAPQRRSRSARRRSTSGEKTRPPGAPGLPTARPFRRGVRWVAGFRAHTSLPFSLETSTSPPVGPTANQTDRGGDVPTSQRALEHQGADASVAHRLDGYPVPRGPAQVVAEHVAGEDERVEIKLAGAHAVSGAVAPDGLRRRGSGCSTPNGASAMRSMSGRRRPSSLSMTRRRAISPISPVSNAPKSPTTGRSAAPFT